MTNKKEFYATEKFGTAWSGKTSDMREDYHYNMVWYFDTAEEAAAKEEELANA
jgi:hypothetical protein